MSWLLNLYEVYEANFSQVGVIEKKYNHREYTLLPIAHTTQNAHIEVSVTEDGEFHSAKVLDKHESNTLIPTTENSANRAGKVNAPYPLHDKLSYVAGDFKDYGREVNEELYASYINQLNEWAESPYSTNKLMSIYKYLQQEKLIKDLVENKILYLDEAGKLISKWGKKEEGLYGEKPAIFSAVVGGQEAAFVRFTVYSAKDILTEVWRDQEMFDSFIRFYQGRLGEDDLCFVTGEILPSSDKHTNKIRNAGDKAKLISANDERGFTFRGRFNKSHEVASISYEASQKAHNALKWLINRQGKTIDNRVFLVWGIMENDIPDPFEEMFAIPAELAMGESKIAITNAEFAKQVNRAIDGFKNNLATESNINILILDSATTGRLAVLYYRNMDETLYLDRLKQWHTTCTWMHRYRSNNTKENAVFYGAPPTKDIAFAAYGPRVSEKVVKGLMERMLPCIVDGKTIPRDITKSAFSRASNPLAMENWEWEKTLSITCALINSRERLEVALDKELDDRDYLFGRLLAIADVLERRSMGPEEGRASNAIRYMNAFSKHPQRTWKTIQEGLQPYQARLGTKANYLSSLIDEVSSKFRIEDFNNKPLSGKYLLGFYSQRHELYQKKEKSNLLNGRGE